MSESLAGLNRAIECHCSVDSAEGLPLRYFNEPGLLKECDEFARHVILCVFETVEQLHE